MPIVGVVGDVALDVYGAPTMVVYRAHRQFATNRNWALTQVVATDRRRWSAGAVRAEVAAWIRSSSSIGRRPWRMSSVAAPVASDSRSC